MDDDRSVYVGMDGGERFLFTSLIAGVLLVPLFAAVFVDTVYDVLRILVLAETAIVYCLQLSTLIGGIKRSVQARHGDQPMVIRSIRWAHNARVLASIILLSVLGAGAINRIGVDAINWREPLLQLTLILLAMAWGFMDRRLIWLERRVDSAEFRKVIAHLQVVSVDRMRDDDQRDRSDS